MQREHSNDDRRAERLRSLPSVHDLVNLDALRPQVERLGHGTVVAAARAVVDDLRQTICAGGAAESDVELIAAAIAARLTTDELPKLRPVINATGILLHTGLGRAPLASRAVNALCEIAQEYASVEIDLATGARSHRGDAVTGLLCELTGAEGALVVNNNAAATLLALATLASGREVIVSRGELIEIGGSYRLPDVMAAGGAVLREVGTTNKTRLADYRQAIHERTAALLAVHTSNYVVLGFAESVPLADLAVLAHEHQLPLVHDVGSGALIDFARFGLTGEPVVQQSLREGADLVLFSGDKLLGGPQCGIVVGARELIERMSRHPLARALRVDKLTLTALHATLRLYRDPARAERDVPLLQLLATPVEELERRARLLADQLTALGTTATFEAVEGMTFLGGGSIPAQQVSTWCVAIAPATLSVDELAQHLRIGTPAILGRIHRGRLLLDLRSVFARQDARLATAVVAALSWTDAQGRGCMVE